MRALVTGVAGFAGSHLAEYLLAQTGASVGGVVRRDNDQRHIAHLLPQLSLFRGDVADYAFLEEVLAGWRPDYIFHLAAQAAPSLAWANAQETLSVNVIGQYNVLAAAAQAAPEARVLVVGSGEEYGLVQPSELPIKETNPLRPNSPYAVSKIAQDMLGYQFFLSHELRTVRVRPFNHIGPRQSEAFVTASFAMQIAEIEAGQRPPVLEVGNLDTKRDFCDVRDIVRAYWLALLEGRPGDVYNLGSGRSHSVAEVLQMLLRQATVGITVQRDAGRLRPSDIPDLVCDASKFQAETGWQPTIPLQKSLSDLVDYWRARVRKE